jgi:hypothetical protein
MMNAAGLVWMFKRLDAFDGLTLVAAQVGQLLQEVDAQGVTLPEDVKLAARSLHAALLAARDDAGKDRYVG